MSRHHLRASLRISNNRWAPLVAATTSVTLVASTVVVVSLNGTAVSTHSAALPKPVPHRQAVIKPVDVPITQTVLDYNADSSSGTQRPASADATVTATQLSKSSTLVRAGTTPISVAVSGAASDVAVHVGDQSDAARLGVNGVVAKLSVPAGARDTALQVALDYSSFGRSGGANFADRLTLVSLPACAATTPNAPACQRQTPLRTSRDVDRHTLTTTGSTPVSAASPMMIAAVATSSGSAGTYSASSLSPSGTWTSGGASGGFTWNYPIASPPAAFGADVTPSVSLGYSSAAVDGMLPSTNNQSGWIGLGWNYSPGYIERTYRTCSEDTTNTGPAKTSGDNCWAGQIVTMSLGGQSTSLVRDDTTGQWTVASDTGQRVQLTGAGSAGYQGEYWVVTTTDGVQYYFGRNSLDGATTPTQSVWTEPVYGAHVGEPCYNAIFASAKCTQAWRWNLDYVVDPNQNVAAYYYSPETNYYGAGGGTTAVAYTRGGTLSHIDYGLHLTNKALTTDLPTNRIDFANTDRCSGTATTCAANSDGTYPPANGQYWQDTPVDQQCAATAACPNHSPAFFSTRRLSTITTNYLSGTTYLPVDTYSLASSFASTTATELWLRSIVRTGHASGKPDVTLPKVAFAYNDKDNRVAGYSGLPGLAFGRLYNITAETGAYTTITYTTAPAAGPKQTGTPACTKDSWPAAGSVTADALRTNTRLCYPVYWPKNGESTPSLDFFYKYVVSQVSVGDKLGLTPAQVTKYAYDGLPAWHYDDNEVVKPAYRTYGQFRGYSAVETRTGNTASSSNGTADAQTLSIATFLRGMNGNTGATGTVTVSDTIGDSVTDDPAFADLLLETRTFNGSAGALLSTTATVPAVLMQTGSRARSGLPPLTSAIAVATSARTVNVLAAGGTLTSITDNRYDSVGRLVRQTKSGTGLAPLCTATTWADNTTNWIRNRTSEVTTSAQTCPEPSTGVSGLLSDVRTLYDGSPTLGAVPTAGNASETDTATTTNHFARTTQAVDGYGRPTSTTQYLSSSDTVGRTTTTAYTPASGGPLTSVQTTNALNQVASAAVSPDRGLTTSSTDVANHTTTIAYDALGRTSQAWAPGRSLTGNPSTKYSYQLASGQPLAVTTQTLVDTGTMFTGDGEYYVTSITLADTLGHTVQTQSDAEGGNRVVTDTGYDSHGWVVATNNAWSATGAPSTTLITADTASLHDRTQNTYDGAGRVVQAAAYDGTTATPGKATTTVYGGDRTTTIPPTGAATTTDVVDTAGRTIKHTDYSAAPTVNGSVVSGGSGQDATYTYDAAGHLTSMTDAANAIWTKTYDLGGRVTQQTDPDSGASSTAFNDLNEPISTTDARNMTVAVKYDALGRKTGTYLGSTSGTRLTGWVYDTVQVGKLTSSSRYTTAGTYTKAVTGYTVLGQPTGVGTTIPAAEGALAGTYTSAATYSSTGLQLTGTPAPASAFGELEPNTLIYSYTHQGRPLGVSGNNAIVTNTVYDGLNQVAEYALGVNNDSAWLDYLHDPQSHKTTQVVFSGQLAQPQIDRTTYSYNPAGMLTSISDVQGPDGSPTETQCFRYDTLARLDQAYTATSGACVASPTTAAVGGPNPYWSNWSFTNGNSRASQVTHGLGGTADRTTTYINGPTGHAHAVASTSTATSGGPTTTASYTYDAAGNTLTANNAAGNHVMTWNAEGRLDTDTTSVGKTYNTYDADGNMLLRHDPASTTLFLDSEELSVNTTTNVVTGTRYFTFNGQTLGIGINDDTFRFVIGDLNGTSQISYDTVSHASVRRQIDPYGNQVGQTVGGVWPDRHGFLNAPLNGATGFTHLGARDYDSSLGRFLSVDPVFEPTNPTQDNGYNYGWNNPLARPDPTGLDPAPQNCHSTACRNAMYGSAGSNPADANESSPSCGTRACGHADTPSGGGAVTNSFPSGVYCSQCHGGPAPKLPPGITRQQLMPSPAAVAAYRYCARNTSSTLCTQDDSENFSWGKVGSIYCGLLGISCGSGPERTYGEYAGLGIGLLFAGIGGSASADARATDLAADAAADAVTPRVLRVGDLKLPGVRSGAVGTATANGKGVEYAIAQGTPEIDPRVTSVRIMNPITSGKYQYPNGYAVYMNASGQTVNPLTGQTISNADPYAHIELP